MIQMRNQNGCEKNEKREGQGEKHNDIGAKSAKGDEVVPGIELGLPESESDVLTITLYNRIVEALSIKPQYQQLDRAKNRIATSICAVRCLASRAGLPLREYLN
jgi:hypothetical protein